MNHCLFFKISAVILITLHHVKITTKSVTTIFNTINTDTIRNFVDITNKKIDEIKFEIIS